MIARSREIAVNVASVALKPNSKPPSNLVVAQAATNPMVTLITGAEDQTKHIFRLGAERRSKPDFTGSPAD